MKNAAIAIGVVILVAAAFWGGTVYAGADSAVVTPGVMPESGAVGGGPGSGGGQGGAFASLSEEQMASLSEEEMLEMRSMTPEDRQTYLSEKFDIDSSEFATDPSRRSVGMRGGLIEGEVIEITDEMLTLVSVDGSSQTIYLDESTLTASVDGATEPAVGSQVMLFSEPEADGVTMAQAVIVK